MTSFHLVKLKSAYQPKKHLLQESCNKKVPHCTDVESNTENCESTYCSTWEKMKDVMRGITFHVEV